MIVLYMTPSLILTEITPMRGMHESAFRPAYVQTWRRTDEAKVIVNRGQTRVTCKLSIELQG